MAVILSETFEDGATLAAKGWTGVVRLANDNTGGLRGSTWGAKPAASGTGSPGNARGVQPTGMAAGNRAFKITFDNNNTNLESTFRPAAWLKWTSYGLYLHTDLGDGHIEISHDFSGIVYSSATGVVVASTLVQYTLCGEASSAYGVADGSVSFYIDGVLKAGPITGLYLHNLTAQTTELRNIEWAPHGSLDNIVLEDTGCSPPQIKSSTVFGAQGTVTSTRTFLANLDNTPRTVNRPGTFYIGGDLVVTGDVIYTGSSSAPTSFYDSLVTTSDGELVTDSDGNVVFVEGAV